MDPADVAPFVGLVMAGGFILGLAGIAASVHLTKLKIKHGYPLMGSWGQSLRPSSSKDDAARVQLLTQENAQLKAEVGSIRERLETVERIVTDGGFRLTHEIERLRDGKEKIQ